LEFKKFSGDIDAYYAEKSSNLLKADLEFLAKPQSFYMNAGISHFYNKVPSWIFILFTFFITVMAVLKNLSLIPILGLLSCLYMMSQIQFLNWIYFTIWLLIGLVVYFLYGHKHSRLAKK
jgi:APA family basic amino acid/polyamine antiporter